MRQSMLCQSLILGGVLLLTAANHVAASPVTGSFVDDVVFWHGAAGSTDSIKGAPDSISCDLDGGATTVRFSSSFQGFDYTVAIPLGTDLIVTERGSTLAAPLPTVSFGYGQNFVDSNNDGIPETLTGNATLLDWVFFWNPPWDPPTSTKIMFFDLEQDPTYLFTGGSEDFFAVVDALEGAGDVDLDAVQLVPEPSTMLLLAGAGVTVLRRRFSWFAV